MLFPEYGDTAIISRFREHRLFDNNSRLPDNVARAVNFNVHSCDYCAENTRHELKH